MTTSLFKNVESQLSTDTEGTYKKELLQLLNKNKEDFAAAKQGFPPPENFSAMEKMEMAAEAAIDVIKRYRNVNDNHADYEKVGAFNSILTV